MAEYIRNSSDRTKKTLLYYNQGHKPIVFLKKKMEKCIYPKKNPIGIFLGQQVFSCLTVCLSSLKALSTFCVLKYVVKRFKTFL